MAKTKTYFFCQECGYQSSSWLGRCPECGRFGTFVEEVVKAESGKRSVESGKLQSTPKRIDEVTYDERRRLATGIGELDRVLGGGIVAGSLLLLGGEPGIGKSTLLLQMALSLSVEPVLYVSAEESEEQIKMRADRLENGMREGENGLYVVSETVTERIFEHIEALKPRLVIVDSIQTVTSEALEGAAGSVGQIRQCTSEFQHYAKSTGVPVMLIGHITKDGTLAGPKVMEHIVDAVLQFEGDRSYGYRMLRAGKNRFGSTTEIGLFDMTSVGLREVAVPTQFFLSSRSEMVTGATVAATLEGSRPLFVEVQSLVSSAVYGTPQRVANGFDLRRLSMLLAVLEKRCGFKLAAKDVFLNIAGGLRVTDPAIDLAVACAVLSSNVDIPLSPHIALAAELGLGGEVRPVTRVEQRIAEADRLGFDTIVISRYNEREVDASRYGIRIRPVAMIDEAMRLLFS